MTDVIKMDYDLMEEMSRTFLEGVEQLANTNREMQNIASMMENGALLGRGGDAFTDAIRQKLCMSLDKLTEKFQELSRDIRDAMKDMQEADKKSAGEFN
jgi:WXG100 family type VII secretion target